MKRDPVPDADRYSPLLEALRQLLPWLLAAAAVATVAALLRWQLIEPVAWGVRCVADPWSDWCAVRSLTLELMQQQRIGWLAAACGLVAVVSASRPAGVLALLSGAFAMTLYAVEPGTVGLLLGVATLSAAAGRGDHNNASEAPATTSANNSAS